MAGGSKEQSAALVEMAFYKKRAFRTERACLRCDVPFLSDGIKHRICDDCKNGAIWKSNYLNEPFSVHCRTTLR